MSWDNVYPHDECCICISPYTIIDNITWFPCNHCACTKCYLRCKTCPICRAPFDRNIKPPIFKTINEITTRIETERSNNGDITDLNNRLNTLRQYI